MYAKSIRPSAKREVQKERSAKRKDQIARSRRAQICEHADTRMCPRSGQIFYIIMTSFIPCKFDDYYYYYIGIWNL